MNFVSKIMLIILGVLFTTVSVAQIQDKKLKNADPQNLSKAMGITLQQAQKLSAILERSTEAINRVYHDSTATHVSKRNDLRMLMKKRRTDIKKFTSEEGIKKNGVFNREKFKLDTV